MKFDFTARLPALGFPTLAVCGAEDPGTLPSEIRRLAGLAPGGRYEEIGGARHFANVERPEAFNRIIKSWLDAERHARRQRDACAPRAGRKQRKSHFCSGIAAMAAYHRSAFTITCGRNSLLSGTMEFCCRSTNSRGPISRKTTEYMRRAKMENCWRS
jgi:hypothetical protein